MLKYEESKTLQFRRACKGVRTLQARPKDQELLQLYGLYKQVTIGDNTTAQPWAINAKERAKWNSWKSYEGTDKGLAQSEYIALVAKLKARLGAIE